MDEQKPKRQQDEAYDSYVPYDEELEAKPKRDRADNSQPVVMPRNIQVSTNGSELTIERRWGIRQAMPVVFFGLVWNAIIIPMTILVGAVSPALLLFMAFFLIPGLFFIYFILLGLFNRTTITVNPVFIRIQHKPLPTFFNNRMIDVATIDRLYIERRVNMRVNDRPIPQYDIHVALKDGGDLSLLTTIYDPDQSLAIEAEIERFLNLDTGQGKAKRDAGDIDDKPKRDDLL